MKLERWIEPEACCDPEWEAAYARFETPSQESEKFLGRLARLGAGGWERDLQVVDIFCGRGGGLRAWDELGFNRLEGVDLSENLLRQYTGEAHVYVGDCRRMAFPDACRDIFCVQGGLHHLPVLPNDLIAVVAEVRRVLRPGGRFVIVEPWRTPFLQCVHGLCRFPPALWVSPKLEALACMIRHEQRTYSQWLGRPAEIRTVLRQGFDTLREEVAYGKLYWIGRKASTGGAEAVRPSGGLPAGGP
jgi:SAM-dependent methyltransferase